MKQNIHMKFSCWGIVLLFLMCFAVSMGTLSFFSCPAYAKEEECVSDSDFTPPSFSKEDVTLVVGGASYSLHYMNAVSWTNFSSSDPSVVTVSAYGLLKPVAKGEAVIKADLTGKDGTVYPCTIRVSVVTFSLSKKNIAFSLNDLSPAKITIKNYGEYYDGNPNITYEGSPSGLVSCSMSDGVISILGKQPGETTVTVRIYGKKFTLHIRVTEHQLSDQTITLYPGMKTVVTLTGNQGAAVFTSTKEKRFTVQTDGNTCTITALSTGNGTLKAAADGITVSCYVSVCNKAAYQAVSKARTITNSSPVYSQSLRMEEGYYDCGSLVWKCYQPYGINFGNKKSAPTAADNGKWCAQNHKMYAEAGVDITKRSMLPGDLIFYTYGTNQTRYKAIGHVAIFAGYKIDPATKSLYGTVIEAGEAKGVAENTYRTEFSAASKKAIVEIARPCRTTSASK
ncbi:MAG: NlpC/P60 family protein [Clostridiales bacterium]|nr:NlpC/P60 family protein [Clostridiales bacterium]